MIEKPWTITCPSCKNEKAYQGFDKIECPNSSCNYFSEKQKELNEEYEKSLKKEETKDNLGFYTTVPNCNELDYLSKKDICDDNSTNTDDDDQYLDNMYGYIILP